MLLGLTLLVAIQVSPPIAADPAQPAARLRVACGPEICVVAWLSGSSLRAVRVRPRDGAVLDVPSKTLSTSVRFIPGPEHSTIPFDLAFDGENFVFVWTTSSQVHINRLSPDGDLLGAGAPADGQVVVEERGINPSVGCLPGNCFLIWGREINSSDVETYGRRWHPSDGALPDPAPIAIAVQKSAKQVPLAVISGESHLLAAVVWGFRPEADLGARTDTYLITPSNGSAAPVGALGYDPAPDREASGTFDGTSFRLAVGTRGVIYTASVRDADADSRDYPHKLLGLGSSPRLAFDGENVVLGFESGDQTWRGKLLRPSDLAVVEGGSDGFAVAGANSSLVIAGAGGGVSLWTYIGAGGQVYFRLVGENLTLRDAGGDESPGDDAGRPDADAAPDMNVEADASGGSEVAQEASVATDVVVADDVATDPDVPTDTAGLPRDAGASDAAPPDPGRAGPDAAQGSLSGGAGCSCALSARPASARDGLPVWLAFAFAASRRARRRQIP
jgi:hypothetical protein